MPTLQEGGEILYSIVDTKLQERETFWNLDPTK